MFVYGKPRFGIVALLSYFFSHSLISAEQDWVPRLTEYGQPDLQGLWTNNYQTPFQRPEELGLKKTYSDEEAMELEQKALLEIEEIRAPIDPSRPAPEPADEVDQAAEDIYLDYVSSLLRIRGEFRTSVIVDPLDGRLPRREKAAEFDHYGKLVAAGFGEFDGPEIRDPGERCLSEFGALPPMLKHPVIPNFQFIQTENFVLIYVEAGAELRTVYLNKDRRQAAKAVYRGHSTGYWEGSTLVVHTNNFRPEQSAPFFLMSEEFEVTERFTPVSENEIEYTFAVTDEVIYSAPFRGETVFKRMPEGSRLFDYSCHEGNYSLPGALAGARRQELDEALKLAN